MARWDRLADPDTEPPGVEPSLQSLIDEVKLVVQEESFIIRRAFPFHEEVLARFLQRVFQQSVSRVATWCILLRKLTFPGTTKAGGCVRQGQLHIHLGVSEIIAVCKDVYIGIG